MPSPNRPEWRPVSAPPEPYELVYLLFEDGTVRPGTWNGSIWWGYDERAKRSHALEPMGWQVRSATVARSAPAKARRERAS